MYCSKTRPVMFISTYLIIYLRGIFYLTEDMIQISLSDPSKIMYHNCRAIRPVKVINKDESEPSWLELKNFRLVTFFPSARNQNRPNFCPECSCVMILSLCHCFLLLVSLYLIFLSSLNPLCNFVQCSDVCA